MQTVADIETRRSELDALCARYGVRRLRLFGSAACGGFDPERSDLDFLVDFSPVGGLNPFRQFMGFKLALQDLFGRSVDLVSARAVREGEFMRSLEGRSIELYAA